MKNLIVYLLMLIAVIGVSINTTEAQFKGCHSCDGGGYETYKVTFSGFTGFSDKDVLVLNKTHVVTYKGFSTGCVWNTVVDHYEVRLRITGTVIFVEVVDLENFFFVVSYSINRGRSSSCEGPWTLHRFSTADGGFTCKVTK